jgi:hypothetical protein
MRLKRLPPLRRQPSGLLLDSSSGSMPDALVFLFYDLSFIVRSAGFADTMRHHKSAALAALD